MSAGAFRPPPGAGATVTEIPDRLASAPGLDIGAVVLVLLGVDAVIVTVVCAVLAPAALLVVVPVTLGMPFLVGGFVHAVWWRRWAKHYPAAPQRADAMVKKNQSFRLGRTGALNNAVHIAADAEHLHLIPFVLVRLVGGKVISLPWERIAAEPTSKGSGAVRATIDGQRIAGPSWCMALAQRPPR